MSRQYRIKWPVRLLAAIMAVLEVFVGWPLQLMAQDVVTSGTSPSSISDATSNTNPPQAPPASIKYPDHIKAKRGEPAGTFAVPHLKFGEQPTDTDIFMARVFAEPLVPTSGDIQGDENHALAKALVSFKKRTDRDDFSALTNFLQSHPKSRWNAAVELELGLLYRQEGYFTQALQSLETSWSLSKKETEIKAYAMANRALGELADLNARFGRFNRMKQIFDETAKRDISGSAQTKIVGAEEGYWRMTKDPAIAFRCGPYAVNSVLAAINGKYQANPIVAKEISTQKGTSLKQVADLAQRVGLNYQAAKHAPGTPWIVPAVVHWKVGHFAAIVKKIKGLYLVQDPTFGGEIWVSAKALDQESTGYALIPGGALPPGWTAVLSEEAATVWGRGGANSADPNKTACGDGMCATCPACHGMAAYNIFKMLATLHLQDIPVGYKPPVGPEINFFVTYNYLENNQPGNFTFMNLGNFWITNWTSYVTVDGSQNASVSLRSGGTEVYDYSLFNSVTNQYAPDLISQAILKMDSATKYERILPDGSKEVFGQPDGTGRIFLTQVVDPQGNAATLTYDTHFRLTDIFDAIGQDTKIAYKSNTVGNVGYYKVATVTDPFSRVATFTYDTATTTQLIQIQDVIGMQSKFTYAENGFINKLTTPYGDTTFYQYVPAEDGTGRGLKVTLPNGSQEVAERYVGHTLTTYYWNREAMMKAPGDRNAAQQTLWLLSAEGSIMQDVPGSTKNALENEVVFSYPGETTIPDPEDPLHSTHTLVGTSNKPATISRLMDDGSVQTYSYTYNAGGNVTSYVDPLGRTFSYLYPVNDQDLYEVRQTKGTNNDLLAKYTYNTQHLPLTATDASGRTTTSTYNSRGQIATVTNAKSEVTTYTYDTNGYLTRVDGPLSGTNDRVDLTYDSYGRVLTTTRVEGPNPSDQYTLTYNYDALDRMTKITYPDSTYKEVDYSRLNPLQSRDRLGRWTQYVYNNMGQLAAVRDPQGQTTQYGWCMCGALMTLTDPKGNATSWTRDVQSRIIQKTFADGTHNDYTYEDSISRLKSMTDPNGTVTNYTYNLDNTIAGVSYTPGSGVASTSSVSLTYDGTYPRLTSIANGSGTNSYSYNAYATDFFGGASNGRGMVANESTSAMSNSTISYGYDELGRVTDRQINGTDNESTWNFDAAGRVSSATNLLGTFTPTYVNASYGVDRLSSMALPNGTTTSYQWGDNTGDFRLSEIDNQNSSSAVVSKFDYTTNAMGNITQWTQQADGNTPTQYNLGYDAVDQLTSAALTSSGTTVNQYYYNYDAAANRTSEQVNTTVSTGSFNSVNEQLTSGAGGSTVFQGTLDKPGTVTINGITASMSSGTNFQANLSLSSGTSTVAVVATNPNNVSGTKSYSVVVPGGTAKTLTYDNNGNLLGDGTNAYTWDAANRLVKVTYNDGSESDFAYDALGRRVQIVEKNSSHVVTSTKNFRWDKMSITEQRDAGNTVIRRYFPDGFRDEVAGANYFYNKDHLGNIREVMASDGMTIDARYDYDPYGRITKISGSQDSDFLYTGQYYHAASGLILAPFRAYDANLGRWLSRDPIAEAGGINLYAYCLNNPVNYYDPNGREAIGAAVGAVMGGISGAMAGYAEGSLNGNAGMGAVAGLVGGVLGGAAAGLIGDPFVSGFVGGAAGDLAAQEYGNLANGNSLGCINLGHAGLAGLLGGGGGVLGEVGGALAAAGVEASAATAAIVNAMTAPLQGAALHGAFGH